MSTTPDTQPGQPEPSSTSDRLGPSEIEFLKQDAKETVVYATARFREIAAQAERDRLTPDEVEALRQGEKQTLAWAIERFRNLAPKSATAASPLPATLPVGPGAPRP